MAIDRNTRPPWHLIMLTLDERFELERLWREQASRIRAAEYWSMWLSMHRRTGPEGVTEFHVAEIDRQAIWSNMPPYPPKDMISVGPLREMFLDYHLDYDRLAPAIVAVMESGLAPTEWWHRQRGRYRMPDASGRGAGFFYDDAMFVEGVGSPDARGERKHLVVNEALFAEIAARGLAVRTFKGRTHRLRWAPDMWVQRHRPVPNWTVPAPEFREKIWRIRSVAIGPAKHRLTPAEVMAEIRARYV
jgi:hypothetical protein